MSPPTVRRLSSALLAAALAAVHLVASAGPAAAHDVAGGELPAPPWLLAYGGAFAMLLTAAVLRSAWPRPRRVLSSELAEEASAGTAATPEPPSVHAGHALGTVAFVAVVVAAIVGPDSPAANVAPLAVLVGWWVGVPIACLLLGDVVARVNPFQLPVAALERLTGRDGRHPTVTASAPRWTSAAFLGAFSWFFLAYHHPGSPRALAVFLVLYALAAVAGGLVWGRGWLARGEGFGALSGAVAQISWRRRDRRPVAGLAALMVVWVGGTAFDAVTSTSFWADVVGTSRGWSATTLSTVGLVWLVAIVAGAYLAAVRLAERSRAGAADDGVPLVRPLGLALVPLATAWFLTHDLTLLLAEGQNLLVLISDPVGEGWDLFGTTDRSVDFGIVEERWVRWVQVAMLAVGHVLAVVVAHDVALRVLRRRPALRATWAMAVLSAASVIAAVLLVLG